MVKRKKGLNKYSDKIKTYSQILLNTILQSLILSLFSVIVIFGILNVSDNNLVNIISLIIGGYMTITCSGAIAMALFFNYNVFEDKGMFWFIKEIIGGLN